MWTPQADKAAAVKTVANGSGADECTFRPKISLNSQRIMKARRGDSPAGAEGGMSGMKATESSSERLRARRPSLEGAGAE